MEIIKADEEDYSSSTSNISKGKKYMTDEKGIHIEHHDHDNHPHGYGSYGHHGCGGYGYGHGLGVFGIIAFIAFVIILWGVWAAHNRNSDHHHDVLDKHHESLRAMDRLGYEMGYTRKQLNDMQCMEGSILAKEDKILDRMCYEKEQDLRFGVSYGEHTQRLAVARPQYCAEGRGHYGGIFNGSPVTETISTAVDHSQLI